jgi:hypothetical protein
MHVFGAGVGLGVGVEPNSKASSRTTMVMLSLPFRPCLRAHQERKKQEELLSELGRTWQVAAAEPAVTEPRHPLLRRSTRFGCATAGLFRYPATLSAPRWDGFALGAGDSRTSPPACEHSSVRGIHFPLSDV